MYLERDIEEILKYPSGNFDYPDSGWEEHLNYLYSSRERIGELERTNEVISKSKLSMGRFYENRFYIFNYQYKNDNKLRKFIDIRPLVFVIDEFYEKDNREIVKGINFNFLPKKARMIFLQLYFKLFFSKHETDVNNFERDELILYPYSRKERVFFLKEIERLYPLLFNAIRYWDRSRIIYNSVDFIRPQDYNILFEYTGYEKSIKGKSWKEVQSKIFN
jgi:hypothetical protein